MHATSADPRRQQHPYASLVDAVRAVLRYYYEEPWLSERANNIVQAVGEPDITLGDLVTMLDASGDRPYPSHVIEPTWGATHSDRCRLAGVIAVAVLRHTNRRLRLEVL